jgi:parvulin-like peptidyl-prolyl isomerase
MSLKDRKTSGQPKPSRRDSAIRRAQRSRSAREAEVNRAVLLASGVLALVIILILGVAILNDGVIKPAQAVASVGGVNISSADYAKRVTYQRWRDSNLIAQYYNLGQYGQQLLANPQGEIGKLYSDLTSTTLYGKRVLDQMVDEVVVEQYAKENGITVDQAAIDKRAGELFNYIPDPKTATPTVTPSITPTPLVSPTASPSPTTIPTSTPLPAGTPTATLTPLPSATFTPFPTGIPTATPGPTQQKEDYDKSQKSYFENAQKLTGLSVSDLQTLFREEVRRGELEKKVQEAVGGKLEPVQEQNKARHILVSTEEEAKDIIAAINAGESFAELAKALSKDTGSGANGGELGWAYKGKYVKEFEDFVWSAKPNELSAPIKSEFGYHIIQLEARETRPVTEADQTQAQRSRYQAWLKKTKEDKKVTISNFWPERTPADPKLSVFGVPGNLSQGGAGGFAPNSLPFGQ